MEPALAVFYPDYGFCVDAYHKTQLKKKTCLIFERRGTEND